MSKNTTCTCATYKHIIDQFSYVDIIYKTSHRLAIESGHHTNVLKERRFCKFCSDIDDDFHFVLMNREYREIRVKYIKYY